MTFVWWSSSVGVLWFLFVLDHKLPPSLSYYFGPALGISGCVFEVSLDIEKPDVLWKHVVQSFSYPPRPFLTLFSSLQNIVCSGRRPSSVRMWAPVYNNRLVHNVVLKLVHPVSSNARSYEKTQLSNPRRLAWMMCSMALWGTVRDFL